MSEGDSDDVRITTGTSESLGDRKSTRLNSSHSQISYAVFCLKKKKKITHLSINCANISHQVYPMHRNHQPLEHHHQLSCLYYPCHSHENKTSHTSALSMSTDV